MRLQSRILLTALILLFQGLAAQDSLVKRRVYLGLAVSSYYQKIFYKNPFYFSSYEPKTLIPLRAGIEVKIKVTPRFGFSTGLVGDITRQSQDYSSYGNVRANDIAKMHVLNSSMSVGVPVRAEFRVTKGKVGFFVTGGWYTSVFLQQVTRTDITYGDGHQRLESNTYKRDKSDQQLLILLQLGGGLDVELKRFRLQLFPMYEGGTDRIYQQILGETLYQHRIGGMLSVTYNL